MTTIKTWRDIDLNSVDFESQEWSYGMGGFPLNDGEWSIDHLDKDMNETRYRMPQCINIMLRRRYENGLNEAKSKIRSALGL